MTRPDRITLAPGLEISRVVTGLWQVADMERDGRTLDRDVAARAMSEYARAGFDSFDMADHYGSAELIAGRFLQLCEQDAGGPRPAAFTKWCPTPGPMTREVVRAGIAERRERLGVETIDLYQMHWPADEGTPIEDYWGAFVELRDSGKVRAIGLSNHDVPQLDRAEAIGHVDTLQPPFSALRPSAAEALLP